PPTNFPNRPPTGASAGCFLAACRSRTPWQPLTCCHTCCVPTGAPPGPRRRLPTKRGQFSARTRAVPGHGAAHPGSARALRTAGAFPGLLPLAGLGRRASLADSRAAAGPSRPTRPAGGADPPGRRRPPAAGRLRRFVRRQGRRHQAVAVHRRPA
uniref:Mobile element protein n=1 Tax=Macrostomum lignano TaxID=282301 RepID=A0A1I8HBK5_9PLAT